MNLGKTVRVGATTKMMTRRINVRFFC